VAAGAYPGVWEDSDIEGQSGREKRHLGGRHVLDRSSGIDKTRNDRNAM